MKCPFCQSIIEDDSRWCDQCGKELMFCPSCRVPRKGSSCPACGELLVSGNRFFASGLPDGQKVPAAASVSPAPAPAAAPSPTPAAAAGSTIATPGPMPSPTATLAEPTAAATPGLFLSGNGMRLAVREGVFGRKGGVFPELSSCGYISGTHGELKFFPNEDCWGIRDCGSTNGTFINGNRLEKNKWYTLKAGYRLRIATLDFNVEQA